MKTLNVALMLVALFTMTMVGCDSDRHHTNTVYVDVPDPIVTNTFITTPGGLTVVEVETPNGYPTGVTQAQVLADLDYQVLYVWYSREFAEFTSTQFNTYLKQVQFHLIVDSHFKVNRDRNVHYAQIGNDVFLAVLRQSSDGHYCADADRAMDLFSNDTNEGHDLPVSLYPAPSYPPSSSYFAIH